MPFKSAAADLLLRYMDIVADVIEYFNTGVDGFRSHATVKHCDLAKAFARRLKIISCGMEVTEPSSNRQSASAESSALFMLRQFFHDADIFMFFRAV